MRAPRFHLLTASPAELAEFWVAQAHELRMAGMEALGLPQLARRCDTCTGELLMVLELLKLLPVTPDETVLDDAIAAACDAWRPHWSHHIDLVSEMAIAMAKHSEEREGVFQTFVHALKALPDLPYFDEQDVMQKASERADSLLEEKDWEHGKLWDVRKVPCRKLPWVLADEPWEAQLHDAMTFLHIWRKTHFIGIEFMADGWIKPPDITCMPFPVSVLGVGFKLEANLAIIERYRESQKKNLEQNMLLLADMLRGLRFGMSPYEMMMRVSAAMPKPLDMDAVMRRIYKRRNRRKPPGSEPPANTEVTGADRDVASYTQEEVDAMVASIPTETMRELVDAMKDWPWVYEDKLNGDDELPKSDFLTPEEVASLMAPVKPKHYRNVKGA